MNRFKGLDLVGRVPEELWTEVLNYVEEAVTKTTQKKKKCKKAKWLIEEALQTAEERREVKSKEERERYSQLNADFQRIARREKMQRHRGEKKKIEWERIEISSRKLEISNNISCKDGHDKSQEW